MLLKKDYSNAFNECEPAAFCDVGRRRLPGCSCLLEWLYGEPVVLVYNGRLVRSSRGQQGCPLMMPVFCATKREMRDRIQGVADLDFVADFALRRKSRLEASMGAGTILIRCAYTP